MHPIVDHLLVFPERDSSVDISLDRPRDVLLCPVNGMVPKGEGLTLDHIHRQTPSWQISRFAGSLAPRAQTQYVLGVANLRFQLPTTTNLNRMGASRGWNIVN